MTENKQRRPLMGTDNILDLQNNGYKNSVSAIAEIIDNSIQANATKIDVIIVNDTTRHSSNIREILIIDDGDGMNEYDFQKALMMNSGTRGGAKKGLGKYGQGLPNASISQTRRVEVFTFQNGKTLYNHIDLVEIFESKDPFLPEIEELKNINIPLIIKTGYELSKTGTVVRWVEPNKIRPSNTKLLVENIDKLAGRIFRYYLNGFEQDGKIIKTKLNILVYDFNGIEYDLNSAQSIIEVKPFDPMFLMEKTRMNQEFKNHEHPTNQNYSVAKKEFEITSLNANNEEETTKSKVEIIFSHVKTRERFREAKGGVERTPFGKIYKKRNISGSRGYDNISIVRANREIDTGDFGFLAEGLTEISRWWSIEIKTEADLDSIIGVDNKKQQASNIRFIDGEEDNDSHEILSWISSTIKNNISSMGDVIKKQYHQLIEVLDEDEEKIKKPKPEPLGPTEPDDDTTEVEVDPSEQDKKDLYEWIKERYEDISDEQIWSRVEWAFSISDRYIFVYSDLGDTALYDYQVYGAKVLIEINYNHSFYKEFIAKLEEESNNSNEDKKIRSIRLLISSFVKAELTNKTDDKNINRYLRKYKNSIAISLDEYIDDLFSN